MPAEEAGPSFLKTCVSPLLKDNSGASVMQDTHSACEITPLLGIRTITRVKSQNNPFRGVLRLREERIYILKEV